MLAQKADTPIPSLMGDETITPSASEEGRQTQHDCKTNT